MATTRIMSMHINKGKTIAQCLKARLDYVKNPDKTEQGKLISAYACAPETADQEFLLNRNAYIAKTGRRIRNEVIAYQVRQSFQPGEVTPEEANKIGYELADRIALWHPVADGVCHRQLAERDCLCGADAAGESRRSARHRPSDFGEC